MKKLIVVPAFNEAGSIRSVILDLRAHGYKDIVLVDDGSTDETAKIATRVKIPVIQHLINRGLGAALSTGFEYAKAKNFDLVVTFDSDGQHKARDIKKIIHPVLKGKCDVCIGSRFKDFKSMPKVRLALNLVSNLITYVLYGVWTTDSLSGLRAFNKAAIRRIKIKTDRMEVSNEFFKEIKSNNLKLIEVPIKAIYTDYSMRSSSNSNAAGIAVRMLIRKFR